MLRRLFLLLTLCLSLPLAVQAQDSDDRAVSTVLNAFHAAAAKADWDRYFALTGDGFIFLGTDAHERWDKPTFEKFARATKGWAYSPVVRHISFSADKNTAWFDEILHQAKYGTCRGTGLLIRQNGEWKIQQYSLTFPIPNDLADGITQQIQTFEERQKAGQN